MPGASLHRGRARPEPIPYDPLTLETRTMTDAAHQPPDLSPFGAAPASRPTIASADTRRTLASPEARAAALPHHAAGLRAAERAGHNAALAAAMLAAGIDHFAHAYAHAAAAEAEGASAHFRAAVDAAAGPA